ncbi:GNAT family N-acetyltransferase [Pseudomonas sp. HMWF032]|uniref:GNAT family N-acetyltransferase n=1 Tax=unclassified Pseudomonas TaxID=196821 RepID=UPI000D36E407|nr:MULTISPECIES: GNAT family N-acetyltransferase [unclassified Pseudomonas]PTS83773.1 GNAT family N-acetyltransferase [Pseudomonas sp. HMWF032]PTT80408.1 GNAT family N-acetyltransferase [Pseudomonas sp. HMWF010]WAC45014.1 GNAT family N-acetyltransferase [Pseudomonas sp. SL4(2022)]
MLALRHPLTVAPVPAMHYRLLPAPLKPLADKFYRSQHSAMRATAGAQLWVAEDREIVAALCLQQVAHGHWLTSLLVDSTQRGQGVARRLIEAALADCAAPVWLFCHPQLSDFYLRLGFAPCTELPQPLAERLARYQRSKSLQAFFRAPCPSLTAQGLEP